MLCVDSYSAFRYSHSPNAMNSQHNFCHKFFSPEHPNRSVVAQNLKTKGGEMMKKGSRIRFSGIVLFGLVVTLSLMMLPALSEARDIKVGVVDTYSGPAAVYGNDALNGFKLALEEINKQGVLGGKIEFTTRDEKFKVDVALAMAKELVMRENVDVLVGTINSGASLAISDGVDKAEIVPFIVWSA